MALADRESRRTSAGAAALCSTFWRLNVWTSAIVTPQVPSAGEPIHGTRARSLSSGRRARIWCSCFSVGDCMTALSRRVDGDGLQEAREEEQKREKQRTVETVGVSGPRRPEQRPSDADAAAAG